MSCLKTPRHRLMFSLFAFLFFSFFLSAGISQDSYATSVHCSISATASGLFDISSACSNYTWLGSTPSYLRFNSVTYSITSSTTNTASCVALNNTNLNGCTYAYSVYISRIQNTSGQSNVVKSFDAFPQIYSNFTQVYNYSAPDNLPLARNNLYKNIYVLIPNGLVTTVNIDFDISDDLSDFISGGSSEPCPVCPVVPDNPYDNKFDAITKAIYTCGAVLIMLYFFFCIYKIIVKDGGSR